MYIKQLDTFYVEIPKTGTGSIVFSLSDLYYPVAVRGHRQVSDCVNFLGRVPSRVTCCVRSPMDRFVSAFNFFCSDFVELDYWLNVLYVRDVVRSDGFAFFAFKSQTYYLDVDVDVDFYLFEDLQLFAESLGFSGRLPREHVSKKHFTRDDILGHPYGEGVFLRYYSEDQLLYDRLKGERDGKV